MNKIRKGDEVIVLAGRDKGKRGKVMERTDDSHLMVEGINLVKKHTKVQDQGGRAGTTGGIVNTEAPIHVSNVQLLEGGEPVRVGHRRETVQKRRPDGSTYAAERSVRISRKTGKDI